MNSAELLQSVQSSRDELMRAIEGLTEAEMSAAGVMEGWSVKDVLSHITAWEAEWLKAWGQHKAGKRPILVETDAEVDALNAQWLRNNRKKPPGKVLADLHGARRQTIRQIENLTEDDLNRTGKFAWLRDRTLADFIAGETFIHEREHAAQIRAWRENRNRD